MDLVPDAVWAVVRPLIPPRQRSRKGGRPWCDDRMALAGIIFVLRTGIPWQMLPQGIGFPSGATCWRRLVEWQALGVWDAIWQAALSRLNKADRIALERVAVDGSAVPAKKGAKGSARTPPTAVKTAPNITSWSIDEEYRSRLQSRRRTRMIPR